MFKLALTKVILPATLVFSCGAVNCAYAANPSAKHEQHTVVDRQHTRVKTDGGFSHTTTKTDSAGLTASRTADVAVNKEAGTRTANVSGNSFEGKSYTGQSTVTKTGTGYSSQGEFVGANGKVLDRSVTATVDHTAQTVTRDISLTTQGGEAKTRTVVNPLRRAK